MVDFIKNDWIYDLETYPNCFTFCVVYANGKGLRVFEISDRRDNTVEMLEFMRKVDKHGHRMVGFNNVGFDYPVLHYIIEKARAAKRSSSELRLSAKQIYLKANEIIKKQNFNGFGYSIKPKDVVLKQCDLFKIHHFDNAAKATSLKMLEFNMRSDNIEDLPFEVGKKLTEEEMDILIKYNKHDVMQTLQFYYHTLDAIRFREDLTKKYKFDCTNFNDTKIGKEYFIRRLEKLIPGSCYYFDGHKRRINQTKRDVIKVGDILFDYLEFERPEFKAIHEWFKQQEITETKGVFSDLLESDIGDVAKYANMRTKRQKFKGKPSQQTIDSIKKEKPLMWVEEVPLKSKKDAVSYWWNWNVVDTMNIVVDGFQFDFGTGGIHGSIASSVVESDDDYIIIDADVASMYPNIAIANRVYPEHLTDKFCDIYEQLYKDRVAIKEQMKSHKKGSKEWKELDNIQLAIKLALNGVYGDSNNKYSPFYDPQYTMTITINGQLSLCMLSESLMSVKGCKMIQANTDGVTVRIPRNKEKEYYKLCKQWEEITGLELEYAVYDKMCIRDVNNYIAVYEGGGVKRKGAYEYENLGWHQNQSSLVVAMAAEYELLGKGTVEEFIENHRNKWDFMLRTKVPRSSRLVMVMEDGSEILQQNICRYYASEKGGKLVKIMPPLEKKGQKYWESNEGDVCVSASKAEHDKLTRKGFEEVKITFDQAVNRPEFLKVMERRLSIDSEWNVKTCNDIKEFNMNDLNTEYYVSQARKLVDELKEN